MQLYGRVAINLSQDHRFGVVGGWIEREDDLIAHAELFHHRFGAQQERFYIPCFLVHGHHH